MNIERAVVYNSMEVVADLELEIKEIIKKTIFKITEMRKFKKAIADLLKERLVEIKNEELRERIKESLSKFAVDEFTKLSERFKFGQIPLIVAFGRNLHIDSKGIQGELNKRIIDLGVREFENGFMNLASSHPIDKRQSLDSKVQMYERWEKNQNMVESLKEQTNLVLCETHSNCSDRCFPWQGRIYSLDKTYGFTEDGKEYVPLEVATDVVDKYGYKNSLLGFNCRHKLVPYKVGMKAVKVTRREQKKQNDINNTQRLYERNIRELKTKARLSTIDKSKWRDKAKEMTAKYKEFCKDNGVVEYRSRIKI